MFKGENMSHDKPKSNMADLLEKKKILQSNQQSKLNPNGGKQGKVTKGNNGAAMVRRSGRGG